MGSPLAPVLANIFMRWFEEKAISEYTGPQPSFYRRYVDDSFLIFNQASHIDPFFSHMNSIHNNIKFTKEEETEVGYFPFLDIKITKGNGQFRTSTYYKPTHTDVYTNWYSFTPRKYKINLMKTLFHRAFNICSDIDLFKEDAAFIKNNLLKNQYPAKLVDSVLANFVERISHGSNNDSEEIPTVGKMEVFLILPYLGESSLRFEKSVTSFVQSAYNQIDFKVVFKTTRRLSDLFRIKDSIPKRFKSSVVYGIYCTNCPDYYVGKTKRHLKKRFDEHRDVRKPTAVSSHMMAFNHDISFDDVKVWSLGIVILNY